MFNHNDEQLMNNGISDDSSGLELFIVVVVGD